MAKYSPARSAGAAALCLALLASACATDSEITADTSQPTTESTAATETTSQPSTSASDADTTPEPTEPATPVAFDLPSADLTDVATGEAVDLATVADGNPLVLWFWAPH